MTSLAEEVCKNPWITWRNHFLYDATSLLRHCGGSVVNSSLKRRLNSLRFSGICSCIVLLKFFHNISVEWKCLIFLTFMLHQWCHMWVEVNCKVLTTRKTKPNHPALTTVLNCWNEVFVPIYCLWFSPHVMHIKAKHIYFHWKHIVLEMLVICLDVTLSWKKRFCPMYTFIVFFLFFSFLLLYFTF